MCGPYVVVHLVLKAPNILTGFLEEVEVITHGAPNPNTHEALPCRQRHSYQLSPAFQVPK